MDKSEGAEGRKLVAKRTGHLPSCTGKQGAPGGRRGAVAQLGWAAVFRAMRMLCLDRGGKHLPNFIEMFT